VDLRGERRNLGGFISGVKFLGGFRDYKHDEIEGSGEIGTHFESRGHDARVELLQKAAGAWRGVSGVQAEQLRFSALGEEAFVPGTRTRSQAVFTLQEFDPGPWALSGGLRAEHVQVRSDGDPPDATELRFGSPGSRSFSPLSASVSGRLRPTPEWTTSLTIGRTQRAPAYYELFANGVHVATAAFERGDPDQKLERSTHAEIGARWSRGPHSVSVQAHAMRFANFIALEASGATVDVTDEDGNVVPVPEYLFRGVPARLHGLEVESRWRLLDGPSQLELNAGLDRLWSRNRATGEPLPRMAPMRVNAGLEWHRGPWRVGGAVRHLARQTDVPATDTVTASATLVNLWASWRLPLGGADALIYARLDNLTNELAYNAAAIQTVRYLSPLAGRSIAAGLRVNF
jgi:iron complex outermembrane receptor protein